MVKKNTSDKIMIQKNLIDIFSLDIVWTGLIVKFSSAECAETI